MNVGFTVLFTPQTSPLLIAAGFRTVWFNVPVPPDTYSRTANYYVKRLLIPATPKLHFLSTRAYMLYAFFWVIPRCLEVICRRFGTICLLHLHRRIGMEMEQTERSETLVYKIQKPGNYLKESIQNSERGESLKSRRILLHISNNALMIFIL